MGVQGPVRCCVSDIGEEWTFWCFFSVVPNKRRCFIADRIREKVPGREFIVLDTCVIAGKGMGFPEISSTGNNTIILVKPALAGPAMFGTVCTAMPRDMPFSAHICAVAFRTDSIGDSNTAVIQVASITFKSIVVHHVPHPSLVGM